MILRAFAIQRERETEKKMRLNNGSTTPLRVVPHGYRRSEDDAIDTRAPETVQTLDDLQLETVEEESGLGQASDALDDTDESRATPELIRAHPLAEIIPSLEGPEFDALVSDINDRGQLEAIVLFESKILDGRGRYRACVAANVNPWFEPYQGDDPLGLVVARNVRRRHLDESQRALIAAKLETLHHGGNRKAGQDAILHVDRSAAAKMLNVGERSVASAAKVLGKGRSELVRAVEQAKIRVSAAAKATDLSAELQRQIAERALAGDAKAARAIIAQDLHAQPRVERLTLRAAKKTIAELRQALDEANADFIALRDPIPPDVAGRAAELTPLVVANDAAAKGEIADLARQYHWRVRDLVAESWSALLSSPASEEVADGALA
jgi:hypothetical protein